MWKVFLCSFLVVVLPKSISGHLIEETCKKLAASSPTIKLDFCVTSLNAAPTSGAATCEADVGLILIELLQRSVSEAQTQATQLVADPKLAPDVKAAVQDCLDQYSDAVTTTGEAVEEYKAKSYGGANMKVSSVLDCASSCNDGCAGTQGLVSPFTANNQNVLQLSALVLSVTNLVKVQ